MLSHESAEGFTADAAARFHSGPSVAVVTWGAGALNLVDAVAGAYAERVPVVVISGARGAHERASGRHLHQSLFDTATGRTAFAEAGALMSNTELHLVGGLLEHARAGHC